MEGKYTAKAQVYQVYGLMHIKYSSMNMNQFAVFFWNSRWNWSGWALVNEKLNEMESFIFSENILQIYDIFHMKQ